MQLLVSVRNGWEVVPALEGGADIIDAKEPARGSLGAGGLRRALRNRQGAAAGSPAERGAGRSAGPAEVTAAAVSAARARAAADGLPQAGIRGSGRGVPGPGSRSGARWRPRPHCPAARGSSPWPTRTTRPRNPGSGRARALAAEAGASGVLLDTWTKDGRDLFAWISPSTLKEWVAEVRTTRAYRGRGREHPGRQHPDSSERRTRHRGCPRRGVRRWPIGIGFGDQGPGHTGSH